MEKFLYLTECEWMDPWVNGGEIPIKVASSYISKTRDGIMTPDENLIHKSEVPIPTFFKGPITIGKLPVYKSVTITNNFINSVRMPEVRNAKYYVEDGLILSFCNHFSEQTAAKFKKNACVKIANIEALKKSIDEQIGRESVMRNCEYTNDHQRNHFLKSIEDEWQDEYRMFWKAVGAASVVIPSGVAKTVWVAK